MQNLSVKRMLALSVVGRAIREIETDPKRGLRRMIDLGRDMSHSDTRQMIFSLVQDMLKKPDSPCYDLLSRAVREIDRQTLQKFSVALGWDCWTVGVQTLRANEEPLLWAIRLTLDGSDDLRALREQWKAMRRKGVRMLIGDVKNLAGFQQALVLTIGVSDGAFLFYVPPGLLTPAVVPALADCNTLAIAVEDGQPKTQTALDLLRQHKCLYGVYRRCPLDETVSHARAWMDGLTDAHGYFAILREEHCSQGEEIAEMIGHMRIDQQFRLIPIAAHADFQMIQQKIFF